MPFKADKLALLLSLKEITHTFIHAVESWQPGVATLFKGNHPYIPANQYNEISGRKQQPQRQEVQRIELESEKHLQKI